MREDDTVQDDFVMFRGIELGKAEYFWFREKNKDGDMEYVIRRVVGEGGGTLWSEKGGHGYKLTAEMASHCCGRVQSFHRVLEMELELEQLRLDTLNLKSELEASQNKIRVLNKALSDFGLDAGGGEFSSG